MFKLSLKCLRRVLFGSCINEIEFKLTNFLNDLIEKSRFM